MSNLRMRRLVLSFGVAFVFGLATPVWACMCPGGVGPVDVESQVNGSLYGASAVFTGRVIGFEYKKGRLYSASGLGAVDGSDSDDVETELIRFKIDQWWKMEKPDEILIVTSSTRPVKREEVVLNYGTIISLPMSVSISMCGETFIKHQSYLVYASGDGNHLQNNACSRTRSLRKAADDLIVLGEGQKPVTRPKIGTESPIIHAFMYGTQHSDRFL